MEKIKRNRNKHFKKLKMGNLFHKLKFNDKCEIKLMTKVNHVYTLRK